MGSSSVESALAELQAHLGFEEPPDMIGIRKPIKFRQLLKWLRDTVCSSKVIRVAAENPKESDLASLIADIISSAAVGAPIPCLTIAKKIAEIGVDRFCQDPKEILSEDEQHD